MKALEGVQSALDGVTAAILQVPEQDLRVARTSALTAVGLAGKTATATVAMSTASAVGTAGTGTAISSLSGAAAANAQLAWLGGGSMATGGVVLFGLALAGGYGVNRLARATALGFPRTATDLDVVETELVYAAGQLILAVPENGRVSAAELRIFCRDGLWPLILELDAHHPVISQNIKPMPRLLFRQHWHELTYYTAQLDPGGLELLRRSSHICGPWVAAVKQMDHGSILEHLRKAATESKLKATEAGVEKTKEFTGQIVGRMADAGAEAASRAKDIWEGWRDTHEGQVKADGSRLTAAAAGIRAVDATAPFAKVANKAVGVMSVKTASRTVKVLGKTAKVVDDGAGRVSKLFKKTPQRTSVVIAVAVQRFIGDAHAKLTWEEDLVVKALRRAVPALEEADNTEIAAYLRSLSDEQLRGVLSSTKGIYHEMLFVELHNAGCETGCEARLEAKSNQPGTDIEFVTDDETVSSLQLKAVATSDQVKDHLERYPDIDVAATEEVAVLMEGVESSGFSNVNLEAESAARLTELEGEGWIDNLGDALVTSTMVRSAQMVRLTLKGGQRIAVRDAVRDMLLDSASAMLTHTAMEELMGADTL